MLGITGLESNLNWVSLVAAGVSQLRAPQSLTPPPVSNTMVSLKD